MWTEPIVVLDVTLTSQVVSLWLIDNTQHTITQCSIFNSLYLLSFHALLLRMEMFAAQWIWTAFRTIKALLLLSCSAPFTAGLPRSPHPSSIWRPSPWISKTDSRTHMCMPGCAQKIQTHTGQTGVLRLRFYAVTLTTNSERVCVCVARAETEASHHSYCVVYVSLCYFHFTTCLEETCLALRLEPQTRHK